MNPKLRAKSAPSDVPCCRCGGPVVEFVVPSKSWNTIIRNNGPETSWEYLCLDCFAIIAAEKIAKMRSTLDSLSEMSDREDAEVDEIERLEAEVERWREKFGCDNPEDAVTTTAIEEAELGLRMRTIKLLEANLRDIEDQDEIKRAYIEGLICECYDEWSARSPQPCDRCQILYDCETWQELWNAEAAEREAADK